MISHAPKTMKTKEGSFFYKKRILLIRCDIKLRRCDWVCRKYLLIFIKQ